MSTPTEQRFQTFLTRVRPHRIAVLTNVNDVNWYHNCLGIVEFLTKVWGGSHSVIIPTDGSTISEEFWAVLSAHDPDIVLRYQSTGADLKLRNPVQFEEWLSAEIARHTKETELLETQVRNEIEKGISKAVIDHWAISKELCSEILKRVSPFHYDPKVLSDPDASPLLIPNISKHSRPDYPLTKIRDVIKAGNPRSRITQIGVNDDTDSAFAPPKLWLAATIGCGDEEYYKELVEQQISPVFTTVNDEISQSDLIRLGVRPWRYSVDAFPLGLTSAALTTVRLGVPVNYDLPTLIIVGDTVRDFCLYFNLYWLQGRALWFPSWFLPVDDTYPVRLMVALHEAIDVAQLEHSKQFSLVSYSVPHNELKHIRDKAQIMTSMCVINVQEITGTLTKRLLQTQSRVYADGNLGNITTHTLLNNNLPGWFESPVPRTLNPASPISHSWVIDYSFMNHLIPRHPALGRMAVSGPNVGDVRAGIDCVSYTCPGLMVMGDHMETNILRPSIHVPDAEEVFQTVLNDCGYVYQTSDKGRYQDATVQKFGSLEKAGYAVWSEKHRSVLKKFLSKARPSKGTFDEGVPLKDGRRYLNFKSIAKLVESENIASEIIDEYIDRGILYRGFIFRCTNCSDVAWHSVGAIDQNFTCQRCGLNQQYKHASWKHPSEPSWFYKLDEVVYLLLHDNGDVPLATLNKLRLGAKSSFIYCPEVRLVPKGKTDAYLEIDICCVIDGKLCIGESKSNASLESDKLSPLETANRYRDLAVATNASLVMFSTSAECWDKKSVEAMNKAFAKHSYIEVKRWASAALYG